MNGAIRIRKPLSPLHYLLSGLGVGITRQVEEMMAEKERKRQMENQVLDAVLHGDVSPEVWTTDLGRAATGQAGIRGRPIVRKIEQMGLDPYLREAPRKQVKTPFGAAVSVPEPISSEWIEKGVPYAVHRGRQERLKEREAQTDQQRKLDFYMAQKRIDKIVDRDFRKSLGERWEGAWREYERATRRGIPVKGLVVRDPETGATMTMDTHMAKLAREKADKIAKTKAGIAYLKEEMKYHSLLMDAEKFVNKLATAETMEPDDFESDFIKSEIGLWQQKELTPQQIRTQARRRLPIINQRIEAQYKVLRKQKRLAQDSDIKLPFLKEFKLDEILNPDRYAGEFETIKAYTDLIRKSDREALRDVEIKETKLRESISESEARKVIISPISTRLPSEGVIEERIEEVAQEIMKSYINPETNQPYTLEQAREHARNILEKE